MMLARRLLPLFLVPYVALAGCSVLSPGEFRQMAPPEPTVEQVTQSEPTVEQVTQSEPTAEQMKADLVGHQLTLSGMPVWYFAALSEFEQFDIRDKKTQANVIEYDVSMSLHDITSDTHFLADALIVYRQTDGRWELISIVTKLYKQVQGERI